MREMLKRNKAIREFGKYVRRVIFHSKYIYFISNTPKPLSNQYGFDRGIPLDRFFIEQFLKKNEATIQGRCLEILSNDYTKIFGAKRVTKSDVLDIDPTNNQANIIGDLRNLKEVADNTYDTIILTQVLQFIDDVDAAISECYRILKTKGTLFVTLPSLSRADCTSGVVADYWRFTQASAQYLFEKKFDPTLLTIDFYGNARSGIYFYAGLSIADTPKNVLSNKDENFPTIITVKAVKA